ncbi:F-box/FBD/LRR-repeat protein At1g13570-like [Ipomoea triloba]|uniref:F-box/FBD/LRR-repeat protein At1g13570-like n=1 Tax=Ipomoea triloba TaxID=35885 RepID=UPI00125E3CFE|nr:F-box/FBD/LRR-repeat protein At1g13570-like [Ipomoea triloba]
MAGKLEADTRRDVMSELPANVKEMILERLPTHEAARTALLSTHWRDAWLLLGRLVFDSNFFYSVRKIKDQWYLFLSRNGVEELYISHDFAWEPHYKLPFCVVLCPTIKQLRLERMGFDFPINAPPNFPCFRSLAFFSVVFNDNANGIVSTLPNLEKLDFSDCQGICNFKINAPKLESLSITGRLGPMFGVESRWFALHLKAIKVLCLDASFLLWEEDVEVASFPTAINLQVIKLDPFDFANEKQLRGVLQLLQKSPNLCELDINAACSDDDIAAPSRLLKDPDSCIINQDLKMLKTIKIEYFCGCTLEILFVKMLLLKSPILERIVITESYYRKNGYMVIKILRELLCFPRASPNAQIVIKGEVYVFNSMDLHPKKHPNLSSSSKCQMPKSPTEGSQTLSKSTNYKL